MRRSNGLLISEEKDNGGICYAYILVNVLIRFGVGKMAMLNHVCKEKPT
jgi:hypothetical protein